MAAFPSLTAHSHLPRTLLPTESWSMENFTVEQYEALFAKIKSGEIVPDDQVPEDITAGWAHVTVDLEK